MSVIPFIDAHIHFWDLGAHRYEWLEGDGWAEETDVLGDYAAIRRTYLPADLLREATGTGLVAAVHVQADWSGPDPVDETRWLVGQRQASVQPSAIVAHVDLRSPVAAATIERHCGYPGVTGIRSALWDFGPADASFRRGFRALAAAGLTFDLRATPANAADCRDLAEAFPDTTFLVGHTGEPQGRGDEDRERWRAGVRHLAELPNVALKISGLGMRDHDWTIDSIRPWILEAIETFGVERCVFGSNWPVDGLYSTYPALLEAYRTVIAPASLQDQEALLWRNAARLYRLTSMEPGGVQHG